jgi:hypothetical protein
MKTTFRKSFRRDLKNVKDQSLLGRIRETIEQVEAAPTLQGVNNLKKLGGHGGLLPHPRWRISSRRRRAG